MKMSTLVIIADPDSIDAVLDAIDTAEEEGAITEPLDIYREECNED